MIYKKNIKIKQLDITDCGAACLSSVCAYYGLKYPIARIRQYAFTNQRGTNILGLIEASKKLKLSAKGIRGKYETIYIIPKPTIAHVIINHKIQHYVVIYKINKKKKYLVYMDPTDGQMHKISDKEFIKIWTGILVIIEPEKNFETGNKKISITKKIFSLLIPHKNMIFQSVFGALIYSLLGLCMSIYVGKITDYVFTNKNINLLNLMSIIMILITLLRTFIGNMKNIIALKTGQQLDATLILGYYKHLLNLPQQFFDTMRVGEIISRINDATKIRNFINNVFFNSIVDILTLVFCFSFMFIYSWKLALITTVSIPLFLIIYLIFNNLNKNYQRKIMESYANLESQFVESIHSISTIKCFGIEEYTNLKTEIQFVHVLKNTYQSIYGFIITKNGITFVSTIITIIILWYGSRFVVNQEMTPGELMVFYSLINYILSPIGSLISSNQTIQDALIAADRLFQIMDLEKENNNNKYQITLKPDMIGNIIINHVHFRYGTHKDVFKDLNLTIEKGKTTAIVGESGSGKSTLSAILQHIYPIQEGSIHIGNYDISQINTQSLRKCINSVPQRIELFSGTIIENIAIGDLEPDIIKVNDLINELGLKEFIENLPEGIMTHIGEKGISLSGGEQQRIAVARALYKDPEIIIFDEATSSLDNISENYIKQALKNLIKKGKTIIIIAHRLNTIKDADNIIVLDKGKVVETGNHQELVDLNGVYSNLWDHQL